MAFNPPINSSDLPMRVEGEYMVLERKDIEIEVKLDNTSGEKKAKGRLFITTARMVFVCDKKEPSFYAFDIPFYNIEEEKFEQPILGSNYLFLRVRPLIGMTPGNFTVKLKFKSGGCGKFVECFALLLSQIRERRQMGVEPGFINDLVSGNLANKYAGFVDPNDPSIVFLSQPEVQSTSSDVKKYYEPIVKQREPEVESFGTGQPLHDTSFPGQGIQIGGSNSQQSEPYQGGMIPSNFQGYPASNTFPTTTTIYKPDTTQQKIQYPTFSNSNQQQQQQYPSSEPNVSFYYGY